MTVARVVYAASFLLVVAAGRYVAVGSAAAGVAVVLPLTMAGRRRRGGMTP